MTHRTVPATEYFLRGDEFTRATDEPQQTLSYGTELPPDVVTVLYGVLFGFPIVPPNVSHMAARITQAARQWRISGRNIAQWRPLVTRDPSTTAMLLRQSRGAPLLLRMQVEDDDDDDDDDADEIRATMGLVNEHLYHVAGLEIRLAPTLLRQVLGILTRNGPMLQSLTIRATESEHPSGSAFPPSHLTASHGLLHSHRHAFTNLRHLLFEGFAPPINDRIWNSRQSLELVNFNPQWALSSYLHVIRRSPSLESLKVVGTMGFRGVSLPLPMPTVDARALKHLYLSKCAAADINRFIRQVRLPYVEAMCIEPQDCSQDETFYNMLWADNGFQPRTIEAFSYVRHIETEFSVIPRTWGRKKAVLTCHLFRDDGVFHISLPVDHNKVFARIVELFPHLESISIGLSAGLDVRGFGYSEDVRDVCFQGTSEMQKEFPSAVAYWCFPECNHTWMMIPSRPYY